MEEKNYLQFRCNDDLPILLANLAHEKLINKLDIEAAKEVFIKSLGLGDEKIALELLSGRTYALIFNIDTQEATMLNRNECSETIIYPILQSNNIISSWLSEIKEELEIITSALNVDTVKAYEKYKRDVSMVLDIEFNLNLQNILRILNNNFGFLKVQIQDKIMKNFENEEDEWLFSIVNLTKLLKNCKDWLYNSLKKIEVIDFIITNNLGDIDVARHLVSERGVKVSIAKLYSRLVKFLRLMDFDNLAEDYENTIASKIAKDEVMLSFTPQHIFPVGITDGWDAGWLSPEGKFYGMNGTYNDMMHIKIAEDLAKEGIIPRSEFNGIPDRTIYLENNGWIKIHHDWILFDGREHDITEEQVNKIVEYGKAHYSGRLKFGYRMTILSVSVFSGMDKLMRRCLFRLN